MVFTSAGETVSVCVCVCTGVLVCVFQYSSARLWPCSSGALSLTDGPVKSEEGQSRQELI